MPRGEAHRWRTVAHAGPGGSSPLIAPTATPRALFQGKPGSQQTYQIVRSLSSITITVSVMTRKMARLAQAAEIQRPAQRRRNRRRSARMCRRIQQRHASSTIFSRNSSDGNKKNQPASLARKDARRWADRTGAKVGGFCCPVPPEPRLSLMQRQRAPHYHWHLSYGPITAEPCRAKSVSLPRVSSLCRPLWPRA